MDNRVKEHAKILVNWSTDIKKGDNVVIKGSHNSHNLIVALHETLAERGAEPLALYSSNEAKRSYLVKKQGEFKTPNHQLELYKNSDSIIRIRSDPNLMAMSNISGDILAERQRKMDPIKEEMLSKKWVLTQHPTNASAQLAGMSLSEYRDFVYGAILRDWEKVSEEQETLRNRLDDAGKIKIEGNGTELNMNVDGMKAINSDGKNNMPSGEVFTAPVVDSVEGEVFFDKPLIHQGKEIEGINLVFEEGKVIESSAEKNSETLKSVLKTDDGAKRLGEIGIGTNRNIDKFTKNMLFDEKMGETVHLAIGQAYPRCIGENREQNESAVHLDMITSMKNKVLYFDDKIIQKEGKFIWE